MVIMAPLRKVLALLVLTVLLYADIIHNSTIYIYIYVFHMFNIYIYIHMVLPFDVSKYKIICNDVS
jgi:predicted transporter